ncbi:MAG TPA: hypothetical protein VM364_20165, partial [Vicinamibacterales bacterium]|nr:hypothetical protein [Vicinamibacterales bacterium]
MDVAQFVRTESSALADRILSAVEEQAAAARARADAELREARGQIDILRADLEGVTARALALEADLDSVIAAHAEVDAARVRAEADLRGARDLLERALREADALREALAHHSSQLALAQDDLASARGTVGAVEEERRALDDRNRELAERLAESGKTVEALRDELAEARETARQRAADADAAAAALHERFETELAAR